MPASPCASGLLCAAGERGPRRSCSNHSGVPLSDSLLTRREAIATLASTATLPLMSACRREPVQSRFDNRRIAGRRGRRARVARRHRQQPSAADAGNRHVARHRHRRASRAAFAAHGSLGGGTAADREPAAEGPGAGQGVRRLRPPARDAYQPGGRAQRVRHGARGLRDAVRRRSRWRMAHHALRGHPERRRLSRYPAVPRCRPPHRTTPRTPTRIWPGCSPTRSSSMGSLAAFRRHARRDSCRRRS